jgi:hypothetical protein
MADLLKVVDLVSVAGAATYTFKAAAGSVAKILWLTVPSAGNGTIAVDYIVDSGTDKALQAAADTTYTFGFAPWTDQAKSANKEMLIDDTAYVVVTIVFGGAGHTISYAILNGTVTVA